MHGAGELLLPFLNFVALIAILGYFLRKPLTEFVSQRHHTVRAELKQVRDLLSVAQKKHNEFTLKLGHLQAEIQQINQQVKQDAEAARLKIVSDSKQFSQDIIKDASVAAQAMYSDVKEKLYRELSAQVLKRSEDILKERLTGDDRVRIRQEFSRQVGTSQ